MTMKAETMEEFAEDYMWFEKRLHNWFEQYSRSFQRASQEKKGEVLEKWLDAMKDFQEEIGDFLKDYEDSKNEVEEMAEWEAKSKADKERARAHGGITFGEMEEQFVMHNADSFDKPLPLEARSFRVSSECKAFHPLMGGYSIFGSSLDGKEKCVRLDTYMRDPEDPLKVDYCYLEK